MFLRTICQALKFSSPINCQIRSLSQTPVLQKARRGRIAGLAEHRTGDVYVDEGTEGEKFYQFKGGQVKITFGSHYFH